MNGITLLIWLTIAIIGIIAIILVKLHYKGDELENEDGFILQDNKTLNKAFSTGQNIISKNINKSSSTQRNQNNHSRLEKENTQKSATFEPYIVPEVKTNNSYKNVEYKNANQVLVDYGNSVQKFQEPIKQSQIDIMNSNNEKTELKDLFTIDELIKESKRKDSEREKEAQKIKAEEDEELNEIKESIKRRKEHPELNDALIEQVEDETKDNKEETINDLINESSTDAEDTVTEKTKIESSVSQKDIEEAINTASKENEEEFVESISESKNITDVLLNSPTEEVSETKQETLDIKEETTEEIKEEELKEPKKIDEKTKESKYGIEIEEPNAIDEYNDLDYRKDIAKVTNTIKKSKIYQDVKEKLTPEQEEEPMDESFIRNVNEFEEYDEYAPIINARHLDYDATYEEYHNADNDQRLRQENTRKVFNMAKNSPEPAKETKPKIETIKEKPERDNIKLQISNTEVVLKKGDEIIFNHQGETYSSQVYAINGDDISVRYRRKNIKIKPSDVKKVY